MAYSHIGCPLLCWITTATISDVPGRSLVGSAVLIVVAGVLVFRFFLGCFSFALWSTVPDDFV